MGGAGVLVFFLLIIVFIPLFIASIYFLIKSKKAANLEIDNVRSRYSNPIKVRIELLIIYTVCMMGIYYEFWLTIPVKLLVDTADPSLGYHLIKGIFDWDSVGDVFIYWRSLIIVYVLVFIRLYIFNMRHNISWYKNNNYALAIFNLGLYPIMVTGFIGWAFSWEIWNVWEAWYIKNVI